VAASEAVPLNATGSRSLNNGSIIELLGEYLLKNLLFAADLLGLKKYKGEYFFGLTSRRRFFQAFSRPLDCIHGFG
jgi:hypothetical protein